MADIVVCALYKFVTLDNYQALRYPLLTVMQENGICGTLLLAQEGINGTVAGSRAGIDTLLDWLRQDPRLATLDYKESYTDKPPFHRTKVKLKKEIVTMGVPGIDPTHVVGTYVDPQAWNDLIRDPEVVLIDTRNIYEVEVGTFHNAINPNIKTFRQFPQYLDEILDPNKHKKVAMFCTGGIRCEKSTAYLKEQGFDEVYHLKGGILKYFEEVPPEESLWEGECFVFDNRVTVNKQLQKGDYDQCHACRFPISEADKRSDLYEPGVSCPHCYDTLTLDKKARLREREKQVNLAHQRGEAHIGSAATEVMATKRLAKLQAKQALQEAEEALLD